MSYTNDVDINISENSKKGKWDRLFIPSLILLVAIGAFGVGKLSKIQESRTPVSIKYAVSSSTTPAAAATPPNLGGDQRGGTSTSVTSSSSPRRVYVAARGGTVYYLPSCAGANRISEKNKIWFETKAEAERLGYRPAKNCKGL
jgi:hypothetical protein